MTKLDIGNGVILEMPNFIHAVGDPEPHTYKGSLIRHTTVERLIYAYQTIVVDFDGYPFHTLLYVPQIITFGLNCNFPMKDVAQYLIWYLRGCKPIAVYRGKTQ